MFKQEFVDIKNETNYIKSICKSNDSFSSGININFPKGNERVLWMGVRRSKFRHVYGQPAKRERCYDNINITKNAHDSHFCAVNPKFIAIVTEVAGGGAFIVLPLEKTGRVDFLANRVIGHSGPVLDIKWNPFNDNIIASCSEDCTVKLWYIPDGGLSTHLSEWVADLHGHKRRVGHIEWHPTAENVIASAGFDYLVILWDVSKNETLNVIDCHVDVIYSMSFNRDGSRLATTSKDKKLRVIDPRTGLVITEGFCHSGSRCNKVTYLRDNLLATIGFSRHCDRQLALWSDHSLDSPLSIDVIDSSSGILFPYFDYDSNVLFLAGKGDGNIRYYEVSNTGLYFLNQYISGFPQKSLGFMPKRGLDVSTCEIFRFYKLHTTKNVCEPISMIVPRKSDQFQDDLYPDTASPVPVLTAQEWISGINKPPQLMSMRSGVSVKTHKPVMNSGSFICEPDKFATEKFQAKHSFLKKQTIPDYRPLDQREPPIIPDIVQNTLTQKSVEITTDKSFKTTLNQNTKFQQIHSKFEKTFENINEKSNKFIENEIPKGEHQLQRAYNRLSEEVKLLRKQLASKDKRIEDLECLVNKLQAKLNPDANYRHL